MGDSKVEFYNRYTKLVEKEHIHREFFLQLLYGSFLGQITVNKLIKRKIFSTIYGWFMRLSISKALIRPFMEHYKIDSQMFEKKWDEFSNFDEFFSRKLRINARPIATDNQKIIFPCDGRHLLIDNFQKLPTFFIKGQKFDLQYLLQNEELQKRFQEGTAVVSRLCPIDYHRFHFPCDAVIRKIYKVSGNYYSVNPIATKGRVSIFFENKRIVSILHSRAVDQFLMIEVGATCIGSITQTAEAGRLYFKGEEKGFFSFGGSTVVTIFQKNKVNFSEDLRQNSENGIETFAFMGDEMGGKQ